MKLLLIAGTRPEVIKLAPLFHELKKNPGVDKVYFCLSGQHRELVEPMLRVFSIVPDYKLETDCGPSLSLKIGAIISELDKLVCQMAPDWMIAQGDTITTVAASIVAFYNQTKFGHVEAGLRTYDVQDPYPEEFNRRVTSAGATLHFAPTRSAVDNLIREGICKNSIIKTGNTVVDALESIDGRNRKSEVKSHEKTILVTLHRRESIGDGIVNICRAILRLAWNLHDQGYRFIFPMHPNPSVRKNVMKILMNTPYVKLTEPLDYIDFLHLLKRSTLVITDSGGIQEEAPSFNIPLVVARNVTERPEGIEAGIAILAGTSEQEIYETVYNLLTHPDRLETMRQSINPYGDGHASKSIARAILNHNTEKTI